MYEPVTLMQEERVRTQLISLGESEKQQLMMAESSYEMLVKKKDTSVKGEK